MVLVAVGLAGCGGHYYREERVVYREPAPVVVERREPVVAERVVVEDRPSEVVVTTFYEDLRPHGRWIEIGGYGRCWYPVGVVRGWRPYTVGRWVYTDYGWSWESEEAWGFATYHYGRWFEDSRYGWVWVPGSTWAPAWVAWRSGGGYVGWAPLGPSIGLRGHITEVETRDIPASRFCFVEERRIAEPRVHEHVVNVQTNTTIINKTTNITNITIVNKKVVNQSLSVEHVEKATGKRVERVNVKEVASAGEARKTRGKGEVVAYRPKALEADRTRPAETKQQEAERIKREQDLRPRSGETREQAAQRVRREEAKRKDKDNDDRRDRQ
jgi:hypothetical protein